MKKVLKRISIMLIGIIAVIFIAFFVWAKIDYKPTQVALTAIKSDNLVKVNNDEFITFTPKNVRPTKGFIFYPGAKVDPESYAPLCQQIAEKGFLVVIAPMPLDLAILSPNKAGEIIDKFKDINTWAIGGHSLGGVMACDYAVKNPKVKGVVLYASYPQGDDLKNSDKKVLSIYGSLDGVANLEKVRKAALPKDSEIVEITGGNHGQFGSYGEQSGDNKATISNEKQIDIAAEDTVNFLKGL